MRQFTKSLIVFLAAMFSFSMAFAETGTETEKDQKNGNKNTTAEGQSYTIDGTYIAGTGSTSADPMTSKGLKFRTAQNGGTLEFTVRENYTITKLYMAAIGNYVADNAELPYVKVSKVEVDGAEVEFVGGEFTQKGDSKAGELTVADITAKQKIVLYFDNSNASAGTQLNASWAIDWERPDAAQPTITVTPETVALVPGATYQMNVHVDPSSFTTQWVSSNEAVATVDENGIVTAVAAGTATISNQWADDATVAGTAVVTVADFDPAAYTVTAYDFTAMGEIIPEKGESAGNIWNEANSKTNEVFWCTNEGLEMLAIQQYFGEAKANTGWKIADGEGLLLGGGAGRCAAIGGIKKGQIVEFFYTGNHFYTRSTDDGIEKTAISEGTGRAIFVAEEDGMIGFEIDKGTYITKINIYYTDNGIDELKAQLQAAITLADGLKASSLEDDIAKAQAAIDNADITEDELKAAAAQFDAAVKAYAKSALGDVLPVAEQFNDGTLDEAIANATAVNAKEDATAEELVVALKALTDASLPIGNELMAEARAYLATFDPSAASLLEDSFKAVEDAIAAGDYKALRRATLALYANSEPVLRSAISKVELYAKDINNETLDNDLSAIKAALGLGRYGQLLIAMKQYEKDFFEVVAPAYLAQVKEMDLEGREGADAVKAAAEALENALNATTPSIWVVAAATRDLVKAVRALGESEKPVFPENATVFDFEAEQALIAAGTVAKPGNVGGSAANGQAFFGWEKADKTDSKRQDYKGYAKAEGSVLPEVCQVWRRSDRFDQDASWANEGGLTCPNDREMAIDGLEAGNKVIVVYDATSATDKELIWAIGDGTSEGGPGTVRATATIDGVEAVTGETTIASGAEILVKSVTPAENGTGYIVFQVKKDMVIKQIAILPKDTTVGINAVNVASQNDVIYNMNGQRVMKAQKGLYIINGRKQIVR